MGDPSVSLNNSPDIETIYYPCFDAKRPVCRQHVNQNRCRKGLKCNFYHPMDITPVIKKKATREFGFCYCGAVQKRLMNKRPFKHHNEDTPLFFVVCSRTYRSMNRCLTQIMAHTN